MCTAHIRNTVYGLFQSGFFMKEDTKEQRRQEIINAAYAVLNERGYGGTSMLSVAKKAKASNETLYNWFGNKNGLFSVLVEENAKKAVSVLRDNVDVKGHLAEQLEEFGSILLMSILDDRAIALNRAAASDPTEELGQAISVHGREAIRPLLQKLLVENDYPCGAFESIDEAVQTYLALLVSDRQIRRVVGSLPKPDAAECKKTAKEASEKFLRLSEG
ncbi:TetR/AcrR family transcriptional regulator [uncultured Cohaesibacter sp.]|uniref:TetR/AcrR family transcriptional regulator n=1 Tax=uncultured Cohaesibacter sp. TaxID=1002546 RepID=UPI0029C8C2C8|nr:TetR/AcrR family transcriptional regulator [uncultured Cohaesibacter sp.]